MAIFNPDNSNNSEDQFFCLSGFEDFVDDNGNPRITNNDSENIVAKIVFSKKPKHFDQNSKRYPRYYIKLDPTSKIFNPKKILSSVTDQNELGFIDAVCKDDWQFKEVTPQIFQKYVTFLRTKNLSWLKDAQRDLR